MKEDRHDPEAAWRLHEALGGNKGLEERNRAQDKTEARRALISFVVLVVLALVVFL